MQPSRRLSGRRLATTDGRVSTLPWKSLLGSLPHNVKTWHRQRQLHIVITAFVPVGEILQVKWDVSRLQIAAVAQFTGDVLENIFRPVLGGIEGDDTDRVTILAGQQVLNYRFDVGAVIGFAPGGGKNRNPAHAAVIRLWHSTCYAWTAGIAPDHGNTNAAKRHTPLRRRCILLVS